MRRLRVSGYGLQMMGALVTYPVASFARILRRFGIVTLSLVLHLATTSMVSAAAGPPANCLGPQPPDAIPNQYIVVLQEAITNASQVANQMGQQHGLSVIAAHDGPSGFF